MNVGNAAVLLANRFIHRHDYFGIIVLNRQQIVELALPDPLIGNQIGNLHVEFFIATRADKINFF